MQLKHALGRAQRRNALWAAARQACADYATFRANTVPIERAIASQLAREFIN